MPERCLVKQLPPEVKEWLDKALVDGNFSGYETLSEALKEKGYSISKSSIHRYGVKFEQSLAAIKLATEQAKAIAECSPDDEGNMNEALMRLIQQKSFEALTKLESDDVKSLTSLGLMAGNLAKSSIAVKKYASDVKARIAAKFDEIEKESKAGKSGITSEALKKIREEIYGIV